MHIALVGAGFSCAVIARELALSGHQCDIFEKRSHIAGNCHTERDKNSGVMVHEYGPHIFHTNDVEVWNYVNSFSKFGHYINRVKAVSKDAIYSLPINLHTINQFFSQKFSPNEAKKWIETISLKEINHPQNFEEQALKLLGKDLYEAFFRGYTKKQWGRDPKDIPAEILKRLPVRFNYDDNYYSHIFQGIPLDGYTSLVSKILDHSRIVVHLNSSFDNSNVIDFDHVFYSGKLDEYFGYDLGMLPYRTLSFERFAATGEFQGCAVMNYCDEDTPFTRITEHKFFAPWEQHDETVYFKEYSKECGLNDIPFYPVHLSSNNLLIESYKKLASKEAKISFVGRLGTFRYLDMDQTIRESLDTAKMFLKQ